MEYIYNYLTDLEMNNTSELLIENTSKYIYIKYYKIITHKIVFVPHVAHIIHIQNIYSIIITHQ
jgi:hypothetical protein